MSVEEKKEKIKEILKGETMATAEKMLLDIISDCRASSVVL